jgi:hypothetical protein
MGHCRPPGWKISGVKKDRQLIADKKEREFIEQVFKDFMAGKTLEAISGGLYWKGIKRHGKDTHTVDWLMYALHARANGYPMDYSKAKFRSDARGSVAGKMAGPAAREKLLQLEGSSS